MYVYTYVLVLSYSNEFVIGLDDLNSLMCQDFQLEMKNFELSI